MAALICQQSDLIARQQAALDVAMIALARTRAQEQDARAALNTALVALTQAISKNSVASKALEMARDSAILSLTTRRK